MIVVSSPRNLEISWRQQYHRLATHLADRLPSIGGTLVEIGCGRGQLTIPLAKRRPKWTLYAVDNFAGPYSSDHKELLSTAAKQRLKSRIHVAVVDYKEWMEGQGDEEFDGVISSEFLPEVTHAELRLFLSECHRLLKATGVTIHSFLSPTPRNKGQRLLIEADSDPKWTEIPPREWFSPPPRLVLRGLSNAGFRRAKTIRLKSGLIVRAEAARKLLRDWDVRETFWRTHKGELVSKGLEIPDWVIVTGSKPN